MVKKEKLDIVLNVRDLSFSYNSSNPIIDNLSFSLEKGNRMAILGKSGCGKSTLLKLLASLLNPTKGSLTLSGQEYFSEDDWQFETWEIRQKIILVFQSYNLFPNLTVLENIALALKIVKSHSKQSAYDLAKSIGSKLGLESIFSRYPNEISGGQSQRVALARAYVMYPSILLLDEVTSAIDPSTINSVIKLLGELKENEATKATSVIMVTHNIRFAVDHSDYIAFMENGTFVEIHKSSNFLTQAFDSRTKAYIQDSKYFT